jgi:hypothetical protein
MIYRVKIEGAAWLLNRVAFFWGLVERRPLRARRAAGKIQSTRVISNNEAIEVNAKRNSSREDNYWENYNSIEADFNVDSVLRVMRP